MKPHVSGICSPPCTGSKGCSTFTIKIDHSCTPPKFNIAPEKWWLEDYFPIGKVTFQGRTVKLREVRYIDHTFLSIWESSAEALIRIYIACQRLALQESFSRHSEVQGIWQSLTNGGEGYLEDHPMTCIRG